MHPGEEDAPEDASAQVQSGVERVGTNTAKGVGQGRGTVSARKLKRALTLLNADEGLTDMEIAVALKTGLSTVGRVRTRYVKEGLKSAISERARPGQKRKLTGKQEAHLVAIACGEPPAGHTHWTLRLLADKVARLGFAEDISLETVRQNLKIWFWTTSIPTRWARSMKPLNPLKRVA